MNGNGISWMRLFWTMLAFVACSIAIRPFFKMFHPVKVNCPDFFQDWISARYCLEGLPIYTSLSTGFDRYREALHLIPEIPTQPAVVGHNTHPPTSVLLALPLARMDFPDAFLAWSVASFVALCVSIAIAVRQCPGVLTPWSILPLTALLLWCPPLVEQMFQGQLNLILLLLFTAAWAADRTGRTWFAGALVGVATTIKLFPGYLFLYFAARRQWRPLVAGAGSFLALTALTILILGPACYRDYATIVVPQMAKWRVLWHNISLTSFWHKLFNSQGSPFIPLWQNPTLAWTAALLSGAVVTALAAWCIERSRSLRERDLAFALTITAMLLVSTATWHHYFTLLFLPLFLLWFWMPSARETRITFWIILIGIWLRPAFYWGLAIHGEKLQNWEQQTATPQQALTALSMQTYVLLAFFVFTVLVLRRNPQTTAENTKLI